MTEFRQEPVSKDVACRFKLVAGPPPIPDVFHNDHAKMLTAQPVQGVIAGISNAASGGKQWRDEEGIPTYTHTTDKGQTHVQVRSETRTNLWEHMQKLTDLEGDVLMAFILQRVEGTMDEDGFTWITAQQILKYRGVGVQTRTSPLGAVWQVGYQQNEIDAVSESVERLNSIWVKVDQMIIDDDDPGKGKRKTKRQVRFTKEDKLLLLSSIIRANEIAWEGETPARSHPIAWEYREGRWLTPFINGANRFIGMLARQVLNYDPYHELWEKRLARYVMFHLRMNATNGGTIKRQVEDVLGELSLPIDERDPQRTRDRFEKAMNRLVADQQISEWHYDQSVDDLKPRKWLVDWLSYDFFFTVPPMVKEVYGTIQRHSAENKAIAPPKKRGRKPKP